MKYVSASFLVLVTTCVILVCLLLTGCAERRYAHVQGENIAVIGYSEGPVQYVLRQGDIVQLLDTETEPSRILIAIPPRNGWTDRFNLRIVGQVPHARAEVVRKTDIVDVRNKEALIAVLFPRVRADVVRLENEDAELQLPEIRDVWIAKTSVVVDGLGLVEVGPVNRPDRTVETSVADALAANNAAIEGIITGNAEFTEEEFSSLLTVLWNQNSGGSSIPIDRITTSFEPDKLTVGIELAGGSTVYLTGKLILTDDHLIQVEMNDVGIEQVTGEGIVALRASQPLIQIAERIVNRALADSRTGVPADVEIGEGVIRIGYR